MAGHNWSLPNPSGGSWDEISFPIRIMKAARETGWFFACQFYFAGSDNGGYIGIQPRPSEIMETRFSVFGPGARAVDTDRCHGGADGGPGVTCDGGRFAVKLGEVYFLQVARRSAHSRIWEGTMYDTYRLNRTPLGAWELNHDGGLQPDGPGFVERYRWCDCSQLPRYLVDFGAPQNWPTGVNGRSYNPHHNHAGSTCTAAQEKFVAEEWSDSVRVGAGWASATCGGTVQSLDHEPQRPCCGGDVTVDVNVNINGER